MPDRSWPVRQRIGARLMQGGVYAGAVTAGLHVMFPDRVGPVQGVWWAVALGGVSAAAGAVAFVATLRGKWMTEWVAVWFVGLAFACYGAIDSSRLLFGTGGDLGGIAVLFSATCAIGRRGLDLYRFYLQTTGAKADANQDPSAPYGSEP